MILLLDMADRAHPLPVRLGSISSSRGLDDFKHQNGWNHSKYGEPCRVSHKMASVFAAWWFLQWDMSYTIYLPGIQHSYGNGWKLPVYRWRIYETLPFSMVMLPTCWWSDRYLAKTEQPSPFFIPVGCWSHQVPYTGNCPKHPEMNDRSTIDVKWGC